MAIFDITYVGDMPYLKLEGGTVTGATIFNSSVTANSGSITNNLAVGSINGVTVGSSPKFTDTTYSVATTSTNGLLSSTDKTAVNKIGSGSLNTTSQTLIGAVNELKASLGLVGCTKTSKTFTSSGASSAAELRMSTFAASDKPRLCFYRFYYTQSSAFSSVSVDPHINVIGEDYATESTTNIQSGISSIYDTGVISTDPYQRYKIGFAFIPPNKKFLVTAYASQERGYGTATFDVYLLTLNVN